MVDVDGVLLKLDPPRFPIREAVAACGAPHTRKTLPGAYFVELPPGCNPKVDLSAYLHKNGITDFSIRTSIQSQYLCGGSVQIHQSHSSANIFRDYESALGVHQVVSRKRIQPKSFKYLSESAPGSTGSSNIEAIHNITGVNDARAAGFTGKGIKVAVIDTGVYYLHPALGGGFGPGYKVAYGYDLIGDSFNQSDNALPIADDDPIDNCSAHSHGTHVAGIVAANGLNLTSANVDPMFVPSFPFSGVAIDATLGAYRVFDCEEQTSSDIVAQAIIMAADAGSHILSLSLGGDAAFNNEIDAIAASRVSSSGHIVVAALGNDGYGGLFTGSSPGVGGNVIGVANFRNTLNAQHSIIIDGTAHQANFGSNGNFSENQVLDIVINNATAASQDSQNDGCTADLINAAVKGKTAFIRFGTGCKTQISCENAAKAGAVACLIYSGNPTNNDKSIGGSELIPSAFINHDGGLAILKSKKPKVQISKQFKNVPNQKAGTITESSSGGLDPQLNIKPDIGGIGSTVFSTISPHSAANNSLISAYNSLDGTSMATPYVSGCIALLLQANPSLTFEQVRAILQNNAVPANIYNSTLIDSVTRQGAGLIQIYNAINSKTMVTPSALSLNDTVNTKESYTIAITNSNKVPVTYTVSHIGAAQANGFVEGDDALQDGPHTTYTPDYANVTFNGKANLNIKVDPGTSTTITVNFQPPITADPSLFPVYSGYIKVTNNQDKLVTTVPYAGMVGSWKNAPIFARNSSSYESVIGMSTTGAYVNGSLLEKGYIYNVTDLQNNNTEPIMLVPIVSLTTRLLAIELFYTGNDSRVKKQLAQLGLMYTTNARTIVHSPSYYDPSKDSSVTYDRKLMFSSSRHTQSKKAQGVTLPFMYCFDGRVYNSANATEPIQVPAGQYKFKFSALKNFGNLGNRRPDTSGKNYDVLYSNEFNLVY
ncbi:hypothetical protein HDU76_008819 [Blyttiomyces sp. JEL0837]|nr:hypothetical protein HDU76_008819 [Blyttiomyces sp. JEL0837]